MIELALRVLADVQDGREPHPVEVQQMRDWLPRFDRELDPDELACEVVWRVVLGNSIDLNTGTRAAGG